MNTLVAIDVSKSSLQVQTQTKSWEVTNDDKGLKSLSRKLASADLPFIICEATGGYERKLMRYFDEQKVPVCRVNPRRVRGFAESEGIKAKTDPIDARVLLRFAQEKQLKPTELPSTEHQTLRDLLDRRSHLTEASTREKNRLQNSSVSIHPSIHRILDALTQELRCIERSIRELIKTHPKLKAQVEALSSIKGVGEKTAWTVLAYLGEIDRLKRNEVTALTGVAPFNKDSGKYKGKRKIMGGRAQVRKCLFMAAKTASRHNPVIKPYFEGLSARGKPYKVAMVAVMRKLLLHMRSELIKLNKELAV